MKFYWRQMIRIVGIFFLYLNLNSLFAQSSDPKSFVATEQEKILAEINQANQLMLTQIPKRYDDFKTQIRDLAYFIPGPEQYVLAMERRVQLWQIFAKHREALPPAFSYNFVQFNKLRKSGRYLAAREFFEERLARNLDRLSSQESAKIWNDYVSRVESLLGELKLARQNSITSNQKKQQLPELTESTSEVEDSSKADGYLVIAVTGIVLTVLIVFILFGPNKKELSNQVTTKRRRYQNEACNVLLRSGIYMKVLAELTSNAHKDLLHQEIDNLLDLIEGQDSKQSWRAVVRDECVRFNSIASQLRQKSEANKDSDDLAMSNAYEELLTVVKSLEKKEQSTPQAS